MTKEEKQKAIDAIKISAPVRVMTQEEFSDYIQAMNRIIDLLELEPCDDAISRQAVLDATVKKNSVWNKITNAKRRKSRTIILQLSPVNPQETVVEFADKCRECGARYGRLLNQKSDMLDNIKNEITMLHIFNRQNVIEIIDKYKAKEEQE